MVKKMKMIVTALLLSIMLVVPVMAEEHPSRVVDEADILMIDEEEKLQAALDEISVRQQFDVAVVTVDSLEGESAEDFADDYYDYNGYGMGSDYDGTMLVISMEEREWYITTCGDGMGILSDWAIVELEDEEEFLPNLSEGNYYEAFLCFAKFCDYKISVYQELENEGEIESERTSGEPSRDGGIFSFLGCLLVGFLLAFIPMGIMKKEMKTVTSKNEASDYMKQGSRQLRISRDQFLYHTITRRVKPKNNSSSGGHRSSSGRSHGGGGGRF